jgi:hypothetical protein
LYKKPKTKTMDIITSILETLQSIPNIYVASLAVIGAGIVRYFEKRKLRKKGTLTE